MANKCKKLNYQIIKKANFNCRKSDNYKNLGKATLKNTAF